MIFTLGLAIFLFVPGCLESGTFFQGLIGASLVIFGTRGCWTAGAFVVVDHPVNPAIATGGIG